MARIRIDDLTHDEKLDQEALRHVVGGLMLQSSLGGQTAVAGHEFTINFSKRLAIESFNPSMAPGNPGP